MIDSELDQLEQVRSRALAEGDTLTAGRAGLELVQRLLDLERWEEAADRLEELQIEIAHAGCALATYDVDADIWTFAFGRPGPAGTAAVAFGSGSSLSVDLVDPERRVSLVLAYGPGDGRPEALAQIARAFVGDAAANLVAARPAAAASAVVRLEPADPEALSAASRLALLETCRDDDEEANGVWPLWSAEAAVFAARTCDVDGFAIRARAEAEACVETMYGVAATSALVYAARLDGLLDGLLELVVGDRERQLLLAAREVLDQRRASPPEPLTSERADRHSPVEAARAWIARPFQILTPRVARAGAPPPVRMNATMSIDPALAERGFDVDYGAEVVWEAEAGTLSVECFGAGGVDPDVNNLWLRVFTNELLLLALAPLHVQTASSRGRASAVVSLPLGVRLEDLRADIVDEPSVPLRDSPLGRARAAQASGREAAAAERLGDFARAAVLWQQCAAEWREMGSAGCVRVALLHGLASARLAQDADRVRELKRVLGADAGDAAALGVAEPFLAEQIRPH